MSRVSFVNGNVSSTRTVPRGGREMNRSYMVRLERLRALSSAHKFKVNKRLLDLLFGSGAANSSGSLGQYTGAMAKKDLWRMKKHRVPWYAAVVRNRGRTVHFEPAFISADIERAASRDMTENAIRRGLRKRAESVR
jgi:hypothetical protein